MHEVESGELIIKGSIKKHGIQGNATVSNWIKKLGTFDREYLIKQQIEKTPEQRIMELEQRVKLLEKQKTTLKKQIEMADEKAIFFDMIIDITEKELKIPIRKKSLPEQSDTSSKNVIGQ